MRKILLLGIVMSLLVIAGCSTQSATGNLISEATIYKSASCGCCVGYAGMLDGEGVDVDTVNAPDMSSVKAQFSIPKRMESCHTSVIGDYFVEGHVPLEAIEKLLLEKPDIDGIALPNMPSGSPGMPGAKTGTWTIYAVKDGQTSVFMTI